MIGIVDYGAGNITSLMNALKRVTHDVFVSKIPEELELADGIIFPGVGSFSSGMKEIRMLELDVFLKSVAKEGKPILGICLGMQLLLTYGDEGDGCRGLDIIQGSVKKLNKTNIAKVPHVGWNNIFGPGLDSQVYNGIQDDSTFYFVHSYHVEPEDYSNCIYTDFYGEEIVAGIQKDNIFAVQFHPEKSQTSGIQLLQNFVDLSESINA